jgi:hypothetical protein
LSPLLLVVLGLMVAALIALAVFAITWFFQPARAGRAALAALIGGSIGFTATALVQAPFYMRATGPAPVEPMIIAAAAAALMAILAAAMILRTKPPKRPEV